MPWKQTSPKKFRQWQRTYWQWLSKIWRAGFNLVWTQMLTTSCICYDIAFLTQRTYSCSNFVTVSSLVLELLKKCRVRCGTLSQHFTNNVSLHTTLTLDTVMNRERPTFVGFCSSILRWRGEVRWRGSVRIKRQWRKHCPCPKQKTHAFSEYSYIKFKFLWLCV